MLDFMSIDVFLILPNTLGIISDTFRFVKRILHACLNTSVVFLLLRIRPRTNTLGYVFSDTPNKFQTLFSPLDTRFRQDRMRK
jgi:hypothetical protein